VQTLSLRPMEPADRAEIAELICLSTNSWYQAHGRPPVFPAGPEATEVFFDVYQALDPGFGIVAVHPRTERVMGSCFFHPRERHVSLGIMNVHPNHFGRGVARALLQHIIDYAEKHQIPAVRLVQSALNLDSFSLYTRAGFVPRQAYQDLYLQVPEAGLPDTNAQRDRIRPATFADLPALATLEMEISGICREKDYRYFIENREGMWGARVCEGPHGIDGFMFSCKHPALNMLGPGAARSQEQAIALVRDSLDRYRGTGALVLVPVECDRMVQEMYALGAKNCELHFCQVRGQFQTFRGVTIPTFLPESG